MFSYFRSIHRTKWGYDTWHPETIQLHQRTIKPFDPKGHLLASPSNPSTWRKGGRQVVSRNMGGTSPWTNSWAAHPWKDMCSLEDDPLALLWNVVNLFFSHGAIKWEIENQGWGSERSSLWCWRSGSKHWGCFSQCWGETLPVKVGELMVTSDGWEGILLGRWCIVDGSQEFCFFDN